MKRAASILLLLCLSIPMVSFAEPLDFSNVIEKDGWLTGEIVTAEPTEINTDTTLRIDCAVPQPLTDEQWVRLHTEFWKTDKKAFAKVLKAVGTSTQTGSWWNTMDDPLRREIAWRGTPDIDTLYMVAATELTASMQAAVDTYRCFFESLGLQPDIIAVCDYAQRDYAAFRQNSDDEANAERSYKDFLAKEAKCKRDPANYTWIVGRMSLRGLPVGSMSYPDGDAREPDVRAGIGSWVNALADKDGKLVNVYVAAVPLEKGAELLPGTQPDWRLAFQRLNEQLYAQIVQPYWSIGASDYNNQDVVGANDSTATFYATYMTLTAIEPVWVGCYKNELVPGYRFTIETRRRKDDALVWSNDHTIDMVELLVR